MNNNLVVFDLDGTIVNGQSQRFFLDYLVALKKINHFTYYRIILWFILYKIGIANKPDKIMDYAFGFLKDYNVNDFKIICDDFVKNKLSSLFYKDAIKLISSYKEKKYKIIIVSNSIRPLVESVSSFLGTDDCIATELEVRDGSFTGFVSSVNYAEKKENNVRSYITKNNLHIIYSYGDHISDVPVLSIADNPVATNPEPRLKKFAISKGWEAVYFN